MSNPWIEFLKNNGGQGLTRQELQSEYHRQQSGGGLFGKKAPKETLYMIEYGFRPNSGFKFTKDNLNYFLSQCNIPFSYSLKSIKNDKYNGPGAISFVLGDVPNMDVNMESVVECLKDHAKLTGYGIRKQ